MDGTTVMFVQMLNGSEGQSSIVSPAAILVCQKPVTNLADSPQYKLVSESYSSMDRYGLAHQEYNNGAYDSAEVLAMELLHDEPQDTNTMILLTAIHYKRRNLERSEYFCRLAIQQNSSLAIAYSNLGVIYKDLKLFDDALQYCRMAVRLQPNFIEGYLNLASTLVVAGDIQHAILVYRRILKYDPDSYKALIDMGNILKNLGRLEEAVECYLKVTEKRPDFVAAWNNLGCVYTAAGEIWLAIHHFEKACNIDPYFFDALVNIGNVFKELKIFDRAEAVYRRALEIKPDHVCVCVNLAAVYFERKSLDLAMEYCQKAIEHKLDCPDAHWVLGNCFRMKGLFKEAEIYYNIVLAFDPYHGNALNNLATLKYEQGNREDAIVLFRKALDMYPESESFHCWLGILLLEEENTVEAGAHFSEAIRINPLSADAHSFMGNALRAKDDVKGAIMYYLAAISINPSIAGFHYNVATIYKDVGSFSDAMMYFETALRLQADLHEAFSLIVHVCQMICDWKDYDQQMDKLVKTVEDQLNKNQIPCVLPHHAILYPFTLVQRRQIAEHQAAVVKNTASLFQKPPYAFGRSLKGQRLRIGYVSFDFGNHPTSHLMQSIPGFHDRDKVDIFCYSLNPDDGTRFRAKIAREAEHFVDLSKVNSGDAADMIYRDGIHILVNLGGYTRGSKNEIFALKPAPIQVMWLGYPGSSGADYVDYFITDRITTPLEYIGEFSEKLAYMPHTYFIGDHRQMFPHLIERVVVQEKLVEGQESADNVTVFNAPDLTPVMKLVGVKVLPDYVLETTAEPEPGLSLTIYAEVPEFPPASPIAAMIQAGLPTMTMNGLTIQNGSKIPGTCKKTAMGEEVPQSIIVTSRQQYGLPADSLIFCNFNQLYKIDPHTLQSWVNILNRVPNSILWLLRFPPAGEINILNAAADMGLAPGRILFTDVVHKEEHVRRGQLADVCLDTPRCNGHTTSMDILWAGTPIVTLPQETFSSRVATSILVTLGCPELIAGSREQYEDIAVRLGNDKYYLKSIRAKVWHARTESTLFDVKNYTMELEWLFSKMWNKFEKGEKPDHITTVPGCFWERQK